MDYQTTVLVAVAVAIVVVILWVIVSNVRAARTRERLVTSGTPVPGTVIAVKVRNGFDRERGKTNVLVKLRFTDPYTGQELTTRYSRPPTREMPAILLGAGAGVADLAGMAASYQRVKAFQSDLTAEGIPKAEVQARTHAFALKMSTDAAQDLGFDADGFRILEPIPVTVYVGDDQTDLTVVF